MPGISLLLAHRGEVIFKEAYGNLKLDQKVQMASSSKSVTATLLMILVDQGKLALDDPVEKYLPEFKGITLLNKKPPARPPTVRNLLSNMSGLPGDLLTESIIRRLRDRAAQARAKAGAADVGADVADAIEKGGEDMQKARAQLFTAATRRWPSRCAGWPMTGWRPSRARGSTTARWASTRRRGWPRWPAAGRSRTWSATSSRTPGHE